MAILKQKVLISNIYVYKQGVQIINKGDSYRWQMEDWVVEDVTDAQEEKDIYRQYSFLHLTREQENKS